MGHDADEFQRDEHAQAAADSAFRFSSSATTAEPVSDDSDYWISVHPAARKGHEAARCAKEQGKFWEYNDVLYSNAPKGSPDHLKAYAQQVGLDITAFDRCFASGKYQAAVQKDIEEGSRA